MKTPTSLPTVIKPEAGDALHPLVDAGEARRRNRRSLNRTALLGSTIALVFVAGSIGWAAVAPLASAALATGTVSPEGNRRVVQHLEGGIVRSFRVRDGDVVKQGDVLIELDSTQGTAALEAVRIQRLAASVVMARLAAEDTGVAEIDFPAAVLDEARRNPVAAALVKAETDQFHSRRAANLSQKSVLDQRIEQSREDIAGLRARIESSRRQLVLLDEEIAGVSELLKKGLERKPRFLALQRGKAQIEGEIASDTSAVAKAEQVIGESRMQIVVLDSTFRDKIATERAQTQRELAVLDEKLRASGDIVERTRIVAPLDGTVVGLRYHTVGGVVAPGSPILDIVPSSDRLTVDVQVSPGDIDVVRQGQPALVRFSAYHQRNLPRIDGEVVYVAADSTQDPKSGRAFFLAKISIDPERLRSVAPQVNLSAGMPAEVSITTGTRTALQYALDPLVRSFERSFVED